jgi:hypothetical protein
LKDINLFLKNKCDIIKGALSIVFIGGKDIEKEKCFLLDVTVQYSQSFSGPCCDIYG